MREFFKGLLFITCALIIIPAIPFLLERESSEPPIVPSMSEVQNTAAVYELVDEIIVYDAVKSSTFTLSTEDFLVAALRSQMSQSAPLEAIKAQGMIMYTYILNRRLEEMASPTLELMGADISTDSSKYPILTLGSDVPEVYKTAVSEVLGKYIAYNDEPIQAAFCVSSGGTTESALTVLGVDMPYLQSVECESDKDYITELVYTSGEVFARITTSCEGVTLYSEPASWLETTSSLPSGYVKEVTICGEKTITGRELASVLNLPSANFTFSYNEEFDRFTFVVKGCGHLVGLSLEGACAMAQNGKTCEEIIGHFFAGVEIIDSFIG